MSYGTLRHTQRQPGSTTTVAKQKFSYIALIEAEIDDNSGPEVSEEAVRQAILSDLEEVEVYPVEESAEVKDGDVLYLISALAVRPAGSTERRMVAPDRPDLWSESES